MSAPYMPYRVFHRRSIKDPTTLAMPQRVPSFHPRDAFPGSYTQQNPTLNQPASENLQQVATRYLRHPNYEVDLVSMEVGARGNCQVIGSFKVKKFWPITQPINWYHYIFLSYI